MVSLVFLVTLGMVYSSESEPVGVIEVLFSDQSPLVSSHT